MKKLQKFYIPVFTGKNFTSVLANKITQISKDIPQKKQIVEHIIAQQENMKNGGEFNTIKIFKTKEEFNDICKEVKSKVSKAIIRNSIDLHLDFNTIPIIQILPK